jgi:hypothetical protein
VQAGGAALRQHAAEHLPQEQLRQLFGRHPRRRGRHAVRGGSIMDQSRSTAGTGPASVTTILTSAHGPAAAIARGRATLARSVRP